MKLARLFGNPVKCCNPKIWYKYLLPTRLTLKSNPAIYRWLIWNYSWDKRTYNRQVKEAETQKQPKSLHEKIIIFLCFWTYFFVIYAIQNIWVGKFIAFHLACLLFQFGMFIWSFREWVVRYYIPSTKCVYDNKIRREYELDSTSLQEIMF